MLSYEHDFACRTLNTIVLYYTIFNFLRKYFLAFKLPVNVHPRTGDQ